MISLQMYHEIPHGTQDDPHGTVPPRGNPDIPTFIMISPHGTEHPGTQNIPHDTQDNLHSTEHTLHGASNTFSTMQ